MLPRKEFLSSFGRNRGRSLRPYQQSLVEELLPQITVKQMPSMEGYQKLALEVGFGAGEHLIAQATHNPDTLFIGVEPYINGVAKCLARIDQLGLKNIRINTYDARLIMKELPEGCLHSAFILFPDPWRKLRHHKRRLVNQQTLAMLARLQKPGSRLLIASDHVDYCVWILEQLAATPYYTWTAQQQADWLTPPADWAETKYQRKTTAQGRPPHFFECIRSAY